MYLYSYYLPNKIDIINIGRIFNCSFMKSIEGSYYYENNNKMIFLTKFNVITFIGFDNNEITEKIYELSKLSESELLQQDYPLFIDTSLKTNWIINNNEIILKEYSSLYLQVIALVVSQSVGLERYEQKIEAFIQKSSKIMENYNYSISNRKNISLFLKNLSLMRHEMWNNLLLLDKPIIAWENEDIESMYNRFDSILEIKSRYETIEYKLKHLKEDLESLMDFISHKHSEFLEWIIIYLIVFEIIMSVYTLIKG